MDYDKIIDQKIIDQKATTLKRLNNIHNLASQDALSFNKVETFTTSSRIQILNLPEYRLLRKGTTVIGGEASSGKTTLALQIAIDILLHNDPFQLLFFTLDESLERAKRKILSLLLANQNLLPVDEKGKRYNVAFQPINDELATILSQPKQQELLKRMHICNDEYFLHPHNEGFINAIAHIHAPKLIVIIDYLQLLPKSSSHNNLRENFNATLAYLKHQVNVLNAHDANEVLLLLISQVSRAHHQTHFAFRETSEIENIADSALVLEYIPEPKSQSTNRSREKIIVPTRTLKLIKNKDGARAVFKAYMACDIPFFNQIDTIHQRHNEQSTIFRVNNY